MERDLLSQLKSTRQTVTECDQALKDARATERSAEQALLDYLEAKHSSATGRYDGLGWASIGKPRLFATCPAEHFTTLAAWLRDHEQGAAIKETVHSSTLSQIVGECLRDGVALPEGISYYLKPQVRLYNGGTA